MSIWAVIPAKDPAVAKSRLAGYVTADARRAFSLGALEHVLEAVRETANVEHSIVVSSSREVLLLAARYGAIPLHEAPRPVGAQAGVARKPHEESGAAEALPVQIGEESLNAAVTQGVSMAAAEGASAVLVLPGDLPLVDARSLSALIDLLDHDEGLVIAPDRHGRGTNALLVGPPLAIEFAYGPDSFAEHQRRGRERGLRVQIGRLPGLALDIDTVDDIAKLVEESGPGTGSARSTRGVLWQSRPGGRALGGLVRILEAGSQQPQKRYCNGF